MKFEKINTKIVVAVGVAIILVLTLVYVIFNTDIIIKHKSSGEDTNTNSNSNAPVISEDAKNRTKDVNSLSAEEKKYIIEQNFSNYLGELETTILEQLKKDCENDKKCPFEIADYLEYTKEPPTKITGCSGRISLSYNKDEAGIDMSAVSCTSGNPNTNIEDPEESNSNVYDGTGKLSDAVKNRQKLARELTPYERMYIVSDNMLKNISESTAENLDLFKDACISTENCKFESKQYNSYSNDSNKGYFIKECSGEINVIYVPGVIVVNQNTKGALKVVKDTDNLKKGEIRLSDALPHLNSIKVETGDYVKKTKTKAYIKVQSSNKNALKVVADNKKPGANEIRLSNVKNRSYTALLTIGDYVAVTDIDAYIAANKNDKDALKVVADFRTPEKGEIKISAVRPYIDESPIKVGDYVTEGIFVADSSKVVCK